MAASDAGYFVFSTLSSCIRKGGNLHVVETKKEAKNFHKNFHDVIGRGVGVEMKRHTTYFHQQIELRVAPKKVVEKPWTSPNTGCFLSRSLLLGAKKTNKKKLKPFFPNI